MLPIPKRILLKLGHHCTGYQTPLGVLSAASPASLLAPQHGLAAWVSHKELVRRCPLRYLPHEEVQTLCGYLWISQTINRTHGHCALGCERRRDEEGSPKEPRREPLPETRINEIQEFQSSGPAQAA